ncbi:MAG: adenine deaminase [Bacteroidales bacterium]
MNKQIKLKGKIVDVFKEDIYPGEITIQDGKILQIRPVSEAVDEVFIIPGLVDSHIHIESSMLSPQMFAHEAVKHGVVATVSDPHEIANVLGEEGINFMVENGEKVPFKFYFGVPSCVPATPFETSGSILGANIVEELINKKQHLYLAEMMNFPGVINEDPEVMKKIEAAKKAGKPIDGHAPGLRGKDAQKYIDAGISTDHECMDIEEARERISMGMKIQIREGSAAKNFHALYPLIYESPGQVMLCSDDKHPDDLIDSYLEVLIKTGLEKKINLFHMLRAATVNPVRHYNLNVGLLQEGDPADLAIVDDLTNFNVLKTYIDGNVVFGDDKSYIETSDIVPLNIMEATPIEPVDIEVEDKGLPVRVIEAMDSQLYTMSKELFPLSSKGVLISDTQKDILKVVVYNRYKNYPPSIGFIKNFNLKYGAIATSIAHDSHNIIAVGVEDESIVKAINQLINQKGGITIANGNEIFSLKLEIAGLMTHQSAEVVAKQYKRLTEIAQDLGCKFMSPFMTLSFMALPVIPELKITDRGLFDVQKFEYTGLFAYKNLK